MVVFGVWCCCVFGWCCCLRDGFLVDLFMFELCVSRCVCVFNVGSVCVDLMLGCVVV